MGWGEEGSANLESGIKVERVSQAPSIRGLASPEAKSHLWRLDRLGSQGWIVVGLSVLGGCCRQSDPTMFLECLLPSTRALNLYHTEPWIQETDLSASPPIFFLVDLSIQIVGNLKEMRIPDHLTYLLRSQYAGQEATVRILHRTTYWLKVLKGI